jgi:hypothetical protein
MANSGVPNNGPQLPSARDMSRRTSLGSIFDDATGLAYDMRTTQGQIASEVFSSDEAVAYQSQVGNIETSYQGAGQWWKDLDGRENAADQNMSEYEGSTDGTAFQKGMQYDVPTSSTNYSRPRTVAAAYDSKNQVMTVVFRDGTFYNYYEVSESEWNAFHASYSKGRPWLNKRAKNPKAGAQAVDGLFLSKPRGVASPDSIPAEIQEQLYRVARTQQILTARYNRPGKKTHTVTHVYTGNDVKKTSSVAEPLQRAEFRKKGAAPGKNPTRLGKNTRKR